MIREDLHIHTDFCDGKASPEENVRAAIRLGFRKIGLLAHSYQPFDGCCIRPERVGEFQEELRRLKEKYRGKIEILCGIEADLMSERQSGGFDYVIGSVHYLKKNGQVFSVDDTPEMLGDAVERLYGGDFYSLAEDYFELVGRLGKVKPDIIGHFDLLKKFQKSVRFDSGSSRYVNAWKCAADALLKLGVPFEINTGGICRGYLSEPYPSPEIAEYIKSRGGKLILSSDAHRPEDIGFQFDKWEYML